MSSSIHSSCKKEVKMYRRYLGILVIVLAALTVFACSGGGGGGGGATATGVATVSLTDAPGDYEHVYMTVENIWFHTSDTAGPDDSGWQRFPLFTPVTIDLIALSNGVISSPVWDNIALSVGNYQQIRILLAGTEDARTVSAAGAGLTYNNEVRIVGDATHYPLRIPDAHHGIRLAGTFPITNGGMLRLAIDFDAGHDVVDIQRNGATEYILKPRLAYCDLDDAGAIVGSIDPVSAATTTTSSHFVIKAEQVNDPSNPKFHVIKRWTSVNPLNGKFVLYPLKPGTYDIVLRGLGYQTVIAKGVPVTGGTTPITATPISMITMTTSSAPDYTVGATITSPTGAWVNFYQTLQGSGELPYEIRFRHFNPITGQFTGFKLSADPVWVGTYSGGVISGLTTTTPQEGPGEFSAVADAILYDRSASQLVSSATPTPISFNSLNPTAPAQSNSISGTIKVPSMSMGMMNNGILFAVHDGMIVNTISVSSQMSAGGSYTMANLPGGSSTTPLPGAFYGVEALGWSTTALGIGVPSVADLRTGDAISVDMLMMMLQP
jgi:hypothetical protein